ncbi:MAG: hypothetical protein O3A01_04080 [bacterium]|nr:hypothetical protein [bacterium]
MLELKIKERQAAILTSTIEHYISTGEPVGSKSLLSISDLGVSAATIRNELAELEVLGYLDHIHTSSGRIPTNKGYRYYVNCLLASPLHGDNEWNAVLANHVTSIQSKYESLGEVLSEISILLADVMDSAAVAVVFPRQEEELSRLVAAGHSRLLKCREFMDVSKAQRVLETLEQTDHLAKQLTCWLSDRKQVIIGEENTEENLKECSLVLAPMFLGKDSGGLAIVGPTRMNYRKLIPMLRLLSGHIERHVLTGRN